MPPPHPQEPSTNPEYANPRDEVWLDIRTGAAGAWIACVTLAAAGRQGFHPLG
jgi:Cu-Zn family superoxide dismutase